MESKRIYAEDARLGNASAFRTAVKLLPNLPVPASDLTAPEQSCKMVSLRVLGLTAFAAFASAQDVAARQEGFFEVTSCHAHGAETFCIYDGNEWEVTSGLDSGSEAESFEGCHNHSETQM